jgi:hypothetical protein
MVSPTPTLATAGPVTDPEPDRRSRRRLVILALVVLGSLLGATLVVRWVRRGGPEHVVRELAEHEAVTLADVVVDRLFAA